MKDAGLPITLIVVGAVWLVWRMGWMPDKDWLIGLGFIGGGIGVLVVDRITKNSVVVGPFLISIGLAWLAHDRYRIGWTTLMPALMILLGVLMLCARHPAIPERGARGKSTDLTPG
jgi:hypothetical protein